MPDVEVIFMAGGGTGGHLYPGVAVADALLRRRPTIKPVFLGTIRTLDGRVVEEAGYQLVRQPVAPFPAGPRQWWSFLKGFRQSVRQVKALIRDMRPKAVLGLGGYAAAPAVYAARKTDLPCAVLNPDLIPGKANRRLSGWADAVFCQWDESHRYLPNAGVCKTTGCPIRSEFARADRAAGIERFGLDPDRRTILLTGASQGARTVNQAFVASLPQLAEFADAWQVLHLCGSDLEEETRGAYQQAQSPIPHKLVRFTPYMADAMAAADLVVCRAGASTLAELTAVGRPAVLLPYPYHKDQHQRRNAEMLSTAGAARIVTDTTHADETAGRLGPILVDLLSSPEGLGVMASTALRMGVPDAADRVADELFSLMGLDENDRTL